MNLSGQQGDVSIDVDESFIEDWLGDDADVLREAVNKGRNAVVVSEPFGGRERIVEYAMAETDDSNLEKTRFEPTGQTEDPFTETDPSAPVHLYENPHHLYRRRIGGYGRLEEFLEFAASTEASVVTSWNVFSWRYVSRVRGAGAVFPVVVEPPPVDTELLDRLLPDGQPSIPQEEIEKDQSTFVTRSFELPGRVPFFGEAKVSVPWRLDKEEASPREILIETVRSKSGGNPGVTEKLWEEMSVGDEPADEDDEEPGSVLGDVLGNTEQDFDDPTAFALRTVVSKEEVTKDELHGTAGVENVERTVGNLSEKGYVSKDGGVVRPEPKWLPDAVGALTGRDTLW